MRDEGERLQIIDTRPCAPERSLFLEGEEREVYLACDTPKSRRTFANPQVVDSLVARKLMLELNGKVLALAVRGDLPAMPSNLEFPGGCMDIEPTYVTPRTAAP